MIHGHVNYIAILTAAIAGMAIGFVWFSPALFGNLWMRIIGADKLTREELDRRQQEPPSRDAARHGGDPRGVAIKDEGLYRLSSHFIGYRPNQTSG